MKRKIIYGLLAVLISFGLWLYVVTVVNPEWEDTFYNIPVVLENEDILLERGLMLVSEEEPKVTLRLSGNRTDMIKLNSSNITLRADLSRIYSAGEQALSYSIVYPGDVPSNAFEIISQTPQQIMLSVAEWKSKDVDVLVHFNGEVPEQYIAFTNEATLDHEQITVTGPSEVVDRIVAANVQVELDGCTDTISRQYSYTLCDADGNEVESEWVKTNAEQVLYTLKIQRWKDIALRVDVIDGAGLTKDDCKITMTVNIIRVSGSEKLLTEIGDELLLGEIDLSEITEVSVTKIYELKLPNEVKNLSEINTVTVTLELPGMATREIRCNSFDKVNEPAGMTASITTKEKTVIVRGPKQYLDLLKPEDLRIQVDFTGATVGPMKELNAQVKVVNSQLQGFVFAVGSYTVAATVTATGG